MNRRNACVLTIVLTVFAAEALRKTIAEGDAVAARDDLMRELDACSSSLSARAGRRADLMRPRITLSALDGEARRNAGMDLCWQEMGRWIVQLETHRASTWRIDRMMPKELVDASPDLRSAVRLAGW